MAESLISTYHVNLIVPITIRKPEYLHYTLNGFSSIDLYTYHFCLTASKDTIYQRLRERGEAEEIGVFNKLINVYKHMMNMNLVNI